jgi:hypothetical protein
MLDWVLGGASQRGLVLITSGSRSAPRPRQTVTFGAAASPGGSASNIYRGDRTSTPPQWNQSTGAAFLQSIIPGIISIETQAAPADVLMPAADFHVAVELRPVANAINAYMTAWRISVY